MVWREHDPDEVATEEWEITAGADVEEEFVGDLADVASRYSDYYDVPYTEAAFRTAGEAVDWATEPGNYLNISHVPLLKRADQHIEIVLYPRNVPAVVRYFVDNWERCDEPEDACKLLLEAAIWTGILQMSGEVDDRPSKAVDFETEIDEQVIPESRAGEDWETVFDTSSGPHRMVALRDVAALWTEEFDETAVESIRKAVRTYADAQDPVEAFEEAREVVWYPISPEGRPEAVWRDDVTGEEWIRRLAATFYEQYLVDVCESVRPETENS